MTANGNVAPERILAARPASRQGGRLEVSSIRMVRRQHADEMEIAGVLVVSRKIGERILIGDKIAITIVKVSSGAVRIGIEAPPELAVMREELAEEIRKAELEAIEASEAPRTTAG